MLLSARHGKTILAVLLLCQIHTALADAIYKCTNAKGIMIYSSSPCAKDDKTLSSWQVTSKPYQPQVLALRQDASGHYFADGAVNGNAVKFVIDTGASLVALPNTLAQASGMQCLAQVEMDTANGLSKACKVKITTLKFGAFVLHDVEALVAPNLTQPLLGMNVLKHYNLTQNLNEMHIAEH